jgi:methylglyoxal synthase
LDAVDLQTHDADKNEVVAFRRDTDGKLSALGSYATGGRGTGKPHLASQRLDRRAATDGGLAAV